MFEKFKQLCLNETQVGGGRFFSTFERQKGKMGGPAISMKQIKINVFQISPK